jgi:S-adenosylmethionine hydrolase
LSVVGLLTDFGTTDVYVGELKAALLRHGPTDLQTIDLCHDIAPGDVAAAGWLLRRLWRQLPPGAVFLAVVDPGVGTARPAVAARAQERWFVGPGNGLAADLADATDLAIWRLATLRPPDGFAASTTFHGRDLFAPAAGHLAGGGDPGALGPRGEASDLGALGAAAGFCRVVWIDRFGNLVTDLARSSAGGRRLAGGAVLSVAGRTVRGPVETYGDAEPGELIWYWGSGDTLEIARRDASAATALDAQTGLVIAEPTS